MSKLKLIVMKALRLLLRLFRLLPINQKKIVFRASNGDSYSCNPKYLSEYIMRTCPEDFKIVWLFNQAHRYSFLKEQGISICKANSLPAIWHLLTARFIIDNIFPVSYIPYRKKQTIITTWHGGGSYKKGNIDEPEHRIKHALKERRRINYRIVSCARYKQRQMANGIMKEDHILEFGSARNDLFFTDFSAAGDRVRQQYDIAPTQGLIVYAPTFRVYEMENLDIDCQRIREACRRRFGKEFVFAFRMHKMIGATDYMGLRRSGAVDISDYEDTQEVIAAADVVITDYSSIVWDVAIAQKPCFLFTPDLDNYLSRVGFDVPPEEWPFPLAKTNDELVQFIDAFEETPYLADCEAHLKALGSYETGHSAEQTVQFMKDLRANGKKRFWQRRHQRDSADL